MTTWLDELRIVKGQAIWTTSFTPPASPYTIIPGDAAVFTGIVTDRLGTFAATEAADTASFTGTVTTAGIDGSLAATEGVDLASITGTATWLAALAATEAADTASITGKAEWLARLAATEAADTASITGAVAWAARLAAIEAADTASLTGAVAWAATLAATEASDTAAFTGSVLSVVSGSLAATEAADTAAFTGSVTSPGEVAGLLLTTEAADTASFTGTVAFPVISGQLAATEASDVASLTGSVLAVITGQLAATEVPDTASFTGNILPIISGSLAATEASDTASFTGTLGTTISAKLVTSFTPSFNRNDSTALVGMEFSLTVNTPFNGVGIRCGLNNTGLHSVELYNRATHALLRSANVDLTGKTEGTFYYADITPITLVAGTTYALMTRVAAFDGQQWSESGPTTLKDAQPGSVFSAYESPLGSGITTNPAGADQQYVGVDLSYSVTVVDIPTRPTGGAGWGDVGRERRRKARGLRQAEKFFEDQKRESQEKIAVIAETAKAEATEARQAGEHQRAQTILLESREQQRRQQQIIDNMLAQARARVEQARAELAQVEALQRAIEQDEEDAISVLLLH